MVGPLPYIGGKNRLAAQIIDLFPPHTTYVEPFAGGAQVFFHKMPSRVEVLNDLDYDVVNFLRVCQWHEAELVKHMRYLLASRRLHELLKETNPALLTDVQRAARFLYLQKNSFGGLITRQKFNYGVTHPRNYNPARLPETLRRAHDRLERVQIESLPYDDILRKYDRETTLFYLDPPYYGLSWYRFNFEPEHFTALAENVRRLKGRFILSINDVPEIRLLFSDFHIREISVAYTAKKNTAERFRELLISNLPTRASVSDRSTATPEPHRPAVYSDADRRSSE
jgi:DNA adenine methylase